MRASFNDKTMVIHLLHDVVCSIFMLYFILFFSFDRPDRVTLHDFVEHIYQLTNKEYNLDNTIGPLDRSKANPLQNVRIYM